MLTATGRPHSSQNFAAGRSGVAHAGHARGSAAPQLSQNRAAARLSAPHDAHVTATFYADRPATPRSERRYSLAHESAPLGLEGTVVRAGTGPIAVIITFVGGASVGEAGAAQAGWSSPPAAATAPTIGTLQLYREQLAKAGVTLEVRETSGSVENIRLLEDPKSGVEIAFVQGGTGLRGKTNTLVSLASLYFEPLWVFWRTAPGPTDWRKLKGRRLAIGPEGSGTRAVALTLLAANGITDATANVCCH